MVVFVDLDDELEPPEVQVHHDASFVKPIHWSQLADVNAGILDANTVDHVVRVPLDSDRENPNRNSMTEALGIWPIISEIASLIDLNTLDSLARSCRQARANLLQYRAELIKQTIRCSNDEMEPNPHDEYRYRARQADWYFQERGEPPRYSKLGPCARDLVKECRRCGAVVCRNCTIKPPAPILFKSRHRRLCRPCTRADLPSLVAPNLPPTTPFSAEEIKRNVCLCEEEGVWLCQDCGNKLRSADSTYESVWRWRTVYGPSLGGLGVGVGEGNRGVICGREDQCCAAREVEEEVDCDAADARQLQESRSNSRGSNSRSSSSSSLRGGYNSRGQSPPISTSPPGSGPGYSRHEIEGIGGVVKTKLVRMTRVGKCVPEYADEMEAGGCLRREKSGQVRSFCGWCWRVIVTSKDKEIS